MMIENKIKIIGPRVLIRPSESESEIGSLLLSEEAQEKKVSGIICGLGKNYDGTELEGLKIGDKIVYDKYSGIVFDLEGERFIAVEYNFVIMVIE
jgi:chaperonin GroES